MKFKITIVFLFLCEIIFSQIDSSKAVIFFKPKDAIIYLDGKKIVSKEELIKISVGMHKIKAWAPKYDLFVDSFSVKKKENKFYSKKLVYCDNYKLYRTKKRLRVFTYLIPSVLTLGFASTYYEKNQDFDKKIQKTYNEAIELQGLYNTSFSPAEFETNYTNYYQKYNDYKTLQNQQIKIKNQGIIITSALAATAITFFIFQKVRKKIAYQETPLLSRINPSFNPINKQICLTINLY